MAEEKRHNIYSFSLLVVGAMPPPVSSAVILTKAIGGNEVGPFNQAVCSVKITQAVSSVP